MLESLYSKAVSILSPVKIYIYGIITTIVGLVYLYINYLRKDNKSKETEIDNLNKELKQQEESHKIEIEVETFNQKQEVVKEVINDKIKKINEVSKNKTKGKDKVSKVDKGDLDDKISFTL
jgi:hypothetical protein